jgi:hypothetical protein
MDTEYLPSIEKAKLERSNTMPDPKDQIENEDTVKMEEGMGIKDNQKTDDPTPYDKTQLDDIEKRVDELQESCDQEEPMTVERKIYMLSKIFPHAIGDRVKNRFDEQGIIDLVGLDHRGVIYLVQYKDQVKEWEAEGQIKKIPSNLASQENVKEKTEASLKTDIPLSNIEEGKLKKEKPPFFQLPEDM